MRALLAAGFSFLASTALAADEWVKPGESPFAGTWSLDGTCASDYGMTLNADGTAGDNSGVGVWAVADSGKRIVMILHVPEAGMGESMFEPHEGFLVKEFIVAKIEGNAMEGHYAGEDQKISARRCPGT